MAIKEQTHFDDLLLTGSLLVLTVFNGSCGCRKLPCFRSCSYRQYDGQCCRYGVRFGWRTWTFDNPIGPRASVSSGRCSRRRTYR